jgi:predicted transcriptional regulator YdeE
MRGLRWCDSLLAILAAALLLTVGVVAGVARPQSSGQAKDASMNPKVVDDAGFDVIGIAERTTNANEMSGEGVIGKQWGRFFQDNVLARIPNKADASIIAVITDYASDKDGEYTHLIGARVTSTVDVPAGMVVKKVPAGKYAIFTSEKGPVAEVVVGTWKRIWTLPKTAPGGDRAYKADYEVYDERARDPENTQMDVHVGIK